MSLEFIIKIISDYILFPSCLFILVGSIYLSFKLRFVQFRFFPVLIKMLTSSLSRHSHEEEDHTILPHKALFTAMSTTLGISTIVAPVFAIYVGGPGALLGFLLTSVFGSAATYAEVSLCIQHRKKLENGTIMGGPMQYLEYILSPAMAKWYALSCMILMTTWSATQANQLAAILDSPLLGDYRTMTIVSGISVALLVFATLIGGIKRIGAVSAKLVPIMFSLYLGACLWIIAVNIDKMWDIFTLIIKSAFTPYAMISGTLVGGIVSALRWGVFKGIQSNEAGIGTQTIPHSMAETKDPIAQGALAMLSTYTAGFVAFLSGCVALITNTWQDPQLPLGISMVAASFEQYFSTFGIAIVVICTLLFAFGTILGNCYNGSQCFSYLSSNKGMRYFFVAASIMVFIGAVSEAKTLWSLIDIVLAAMALPHMAGLILYAYKHPERIISGEQKEEVIIPLRSGNSEFGIQNSE